MLKKTLASEKNKTWPNRLGTFGKNWHTTESPNQSGYYMNYSYCHLLVITGYSYGIIHSLDGAISTYNW
jgi:hypothetical protein